VAGFQTFPTGRISTFGDIRVRSGIDAERETERVTEIKRLTNVPTTFVNTTIRVSAQQQLRPFRSSGKPQ
jgi:hypothetical protein